MTTTDALALLLALSAALHIGCATVFTARRGGVGSAHAVLAGAGATGTALSLYFAAIAVYR
jgi:hypothetical protein